MAFYENSKTERVKIVNQISSNLILDLEKKDSINHVKYFSDSDTYIRKTAYLALGKLYETNQELQKTILLFLQQLLKSDNEKIRQTTINAAGEIGMKWFTIAAPFMDAGLFDAHHSVRNAVIGSIKKMGQKNPVPVLQWARQYLHHPDKEIRREICHGIELRGRTHPQDILPLLQELQHDHTKRVSKTLVHVLGQISYKKGCLATVIEALNYWDNKPLVQEALEEIIDVHDRYKDFAILTTQEAANYIKQNYKKDDSNNY